MRTSIYLILSAAIGLLTYLHQAWAPLLWLPLTFTHLHTRPRSLAIAALQGYAGACVAFLGGTALWLPGAVEKASGTSWIMTAAVVGMTVLFQGIHGFVVGAASACGRGSSSRLAAMATAYWIMESGFPNLLSMSPGEILAHYPVLHPAISVLGTIGLTGLAASGATAAIVGLLSRSRALVATGLACWAGILAPLLSGSGRPVAPSGDSEPGTLRTLVIQSNRNTLQPEVDLASTSDPYERYLSGLAGFIEERLGREGADLIVTPESSMPIAPGIPWSAETERRWRNRVDLRMPSLLRKHGAYFLGGFRDQTLTGFQDQFRHSRRASLTHFTLLLDPHGVVVDRVSKRDLIPFMEYLPGSTRLPVLREIFSWANSQVEGVSRQVVSVKGFKVASLICYDSFFRDSYWAALEQEADFALVLTNDLMLTEHGAWYHHLATEARRLEYGLPVIYAGNSGYTGLMGSPPLPWGRREAVLLRMPKATERGTFYSRVLGRALEPAMVAAAWAVFLASLAAAGISLWRRRRKGLSMARVLLSEPAWLGIAAAVGVLAWLNLRVAQFVLVPSESMQPALQPGARVVVCKWDRDRVSRGEVVSFFDETTRLYLIKRAFLVPGDSYRFNGGKPEINGSPLLASAPRPGLWIQSGGMQPTLALKASEAADLFPRMDLTMRPGEYFLLGDHRDKSSDSRKFGPVHEESLVGRMCWQL